MYSDFIDQLEQTFTTSVQVMSDPDWEEFHRQGDAVAYRKSSDIGIDYLKIDCLSTNPAKELSRTVYDNFVQAALSTADDVEECREVTVFNEDAKLLYVRNKSLGPVSAREVYLFLTIFEAEEGVYCIAGKSVEHSTLAMDSSVVRAEVDALVFTFQDLESGYCRVGYLLHSDAGGSVPVFLVNSFLGDRVTNFSKQMAEAETSLQSRVR
jgi:hypothetical protein